MIKKYSMVGLKFAKKNPKKHKERMRIRPETITISGTVLRRRTKKNQHGSRSQRIEVNVSRIQRNQKRAPILELKRSKRAKFKVLLGKSAGVRAQNHEIRVQCRNLDEDYNAVSWKCLPYRHLARACTSVVYRSDRLHTMWGKESHCPGLCQGSQMRATR